MKSDLNYLSDISGFFWRGLMDGDIEETAWTYFAVCVPIVVFFAPFGSFLSSHFHRQVLAALIYVLDTVALVRKYVLRPSNILGCHLELVN